MDKCTILVSSCDKYEDAWEPFFRLLKIQWPTCPYDIVLSTETKSYDCKFLNVKTINSGAELSWSSRLRKVLSEIQTEYVLFFLEDFFLMSPVKEDVFYSALNLIVNQNNIGAISFNPDIDWRYWKIKDCVGDYFAFLTKKSKYRVNAIAMLWRKDFLMSILKDGENPWEFEINGTKRAKFKSQKILCVPDKKNKVFDFHVFISYGYGISKQRWLPQNKALFEKYAIEVDFDRLGWYERATKRKKRSLREKIELIYKNPKELMGMFITKIKQLIG